MAARLSLVISESSVSIPNNTSVVTAKLYYYGNGVSYNYNSKPGTIVIDGTSYSFSASFTKSTSAQLLATKSKTVTHNSNGAKTVSCSASYTTGVSIGTLSTSASKTLTTIPRVSDLSLNKTSVPADGTTTVTATATKKSSSFTDTITVKLGSYSKTVTSGKAFTIPTTWINAITGTSKTATVKVTTKSGSTTIGTKSVNLTVTVPSSVVPSISSVTASEAITAVQTAFGSGVYVSSLSKLNVSISAAGVYGSTISSVKTTFDGITYTGAEFQTAAISKAGTLTMSVTVTDSRGRTKTTTKNITVYGYSSPIITNISCVSSGTSTIVTVDGVVSPVAVGSANKNTKTLTIGYKKSTASAYGGTTTVTIPAASWTFSVSKTFALDSRTITYDFETKLKDKISTTTEHGTTGKPVLSRKAGATGVTFGAEATEDGLVLAAGWDVKIKDGDILIDDPELEALYDEVFGGGVISQDFSTWTNSGGTITEENGVSIVTFSQELASGVNYKSIYAPSISKEQLVGKTVHFSVWLKIADVSEVTYKHVLQFRTYTSDGTGISYWEHAYTSSYFNNPEMTDNTWRRLECSIPWSTILSKSNFYEEAYDSNDSAKMRIRLLLCGNGTYSYKLPTLELI